MEIRQEKVENNRPPVRSPASADDPEWAGGLLARLISRKSSVVYK